MVRFIRRRVLDGELMLGAGCVLGSSLTAEMAGKAGADIVLILGVSPDSMIREAVLAGKKYNVTKPEDYERLDEEGVYTHCPGIIKDALHFAAEIIVEKT